MDWLWALLGSYCLIGVYDGVKRFSAGSSPLVGAVWPVADILTTLFSSLGSLLSGLIQIAPASAPALQNLENQLTTLNTNFAGLATSFEQGLTNLANTIAQALANQPTTGGGTPSGGGGAGPAPSQAKPGAPNPPAPQKASGPPASPPK